MKVIIVIKSYQTNIVTPEQTTMSKVAKNGLTVDEMVENRMIWFKKSGSIDKRCSAYRQKIVDENCEIIMQKETEVHDDDSKNVPKGLYAAKLRQKQSAITPQIKTRSAKSLDPTVFKSCDSSNSLSSLMISETDEVIDEKNMDIVTGWLIDLHNAARKYLLITPDQSREILEMTLGMMRRFLKCNKVKNEKLQLVAIVAWRISYKLLDDDFGMSNKECNRLCKNAYTISEICDLEFQLINYISYQVCRDGINDEEFLKKHKGGIENAQTSNNDIAKMVRMC